MENSKLSFLSDTADLLTGETSPSALADSLTALLKKEIALKTFNMYAFDSVTNTMRDCINGWNIIEDSPEIYIAFQNIKEHDFVINSKAYKLPASIGEITLKINSLFMPIVKDEKVFGLIHLEFEENTSVNMEFLFLMKIFASQVSLKLQNIILNEQSKINVEFHMKQRQWRKKMLKIYSNILKLILLIIKGLNF